MKPSIRSSLFLILPLILICSNSYARFATKDEFDFSVDFQNTEVQVNKDGTYEATIENQYTVLKESGRDRISKLIYSYAPDTSKFKIISAHTIVDGKTIEVPSNMIEDKSVASTAQGFDKNNQVMVAYPQVSVGAQIYIKYSMTVKKVPIPGFFSMHFGYGLGMIETSGTTTLTSALPLKFSKNDQIDGLKITDEKVGKLQKITITQTKPAFNKVMEESNPMMDSGSYSSAEVSSADSWNIIARTYSEGFNQRLKEALPKTFSQIAVDAKKMSTPEEQIRFVTTTLAKKVTYLGDWRTTNGKYAPRAFKDVEATGVGDCKDYATVTSAILQKLGIKSEVAIVGLSLNQVDNMKAGGMPGVLPFTLPTASLFNHAIVKLSVKDKTYWIDPTNSANLVTSPSYLISGKPVLVLNSKNSKLETIPELTPDQSKTIITKTVDLGNDHSIEAQGLVHFSGINAAGVTTVTKNLSKTQIDGLYTALASSETKTSWSHVDDVTSENASEIDAKVKYSSEHLKQKDASNFIYQFPLDQRLLLFSADHSKRVSNMYLGNIDTIERNYTFKNLTLKGDGPSECWAVSPWGELSRKVEQKDGVLTVKEKYSSKKTMITATELKSKDFDIFKDNVIRCLRSSAFTYSSNPSNEKEKDSAVKVTTNDKPETDEELEKDYKIAKEILIRSGPQSNSDQLHAKSIFEKYISKHPNHAGSRINLALITLDLGYLKGNTFASENLNIAEASLKKAIEIDPKLPLAYCQLARIYSLQKKFKESDDSINETLKLDPEFSEAYAVKGLNLNLQDKLNAAVESYKKAAEFSKDDIAKSGFYDRMGLILMKITLYDEALDYFEKALDIQPKNAWIHHNYSLLLGAMYRFDDAIEQSEKALKLADFGAAHSYLANLYFAKGEKIYWKEKDQDEGLKYFQKALEQDPSHQNAMCGVAYYYFDQSKKSDKKKDPLDQAKTRFQKVLSINSNHVWAKKGLDLVNKELSRVPASE